MGRGMAGTSSTLADVRRDTLASTIAMVLLRGLVRLADIAAQGTGGRFAVAPEEQTGEHDLGHYVENAVEDGLGVRVNDVTAFGQTPGDRIEEPEQQQPLCHWGQ